MANYELDIPFSTEMRKLDPKEPNHADTAFNPHFKQLVNNDNYLLNQVIEALRQLGIHVHTKTQITDFAHTHTPAEAGAAPATHNHTKNQITDFAHTHIPAETGSAPASHTHSKEQITNFPASLPANGGNADTVDGKHASDFAAVNHGIHVPSGGTASTFLRGDSTWQTIAALGGVTAYSLAANGYVKFACGLILQWGKSQRGVWTTLPIQFPTAIFCGVSTLRSQESKSGGITIDYTLTRVRCNYDSVTEIPHNYILIGS